MTTLTVVLVLVEGTLLLQLVGRPGAKYLPSEVTDHFAAAGPHLDLAILQSQDFFLLIEEDEGLRGLEALYTDLLLGPGVVDDEVLFASLDHDLLVKLLKELNLLTNVNELEFHQFLASLHFDQSHGYLIVLVVVKQ